MTGFTKGFCQMAAWSDLIGGIGARLAAYPALARFVDALQALPGLPEKSSDTPPARLPVQNFWPAAGAADALGQLTAEVDKTLSVAWRQNPNYVAQPPSGAFLDNYGYLECAGPTAPVRDDGLRLGLLLLGPNTLYPPHHHPAEEVYLPLGPGRWLRDGAGWTEVPAGAVIHHPPMCGHATQSGDAPLAALYLWRGEIGPAARIG